MRYCQWFGVLLTLFIVSSCKSPSIKSGWQNEIIYFILIDRFENGDPFNDSGNNPASHVPYDGTNPEALKTYQGGDLRGVIQRLNYLDSLGITALWISPFFNNSDSDFVGWWPYHGYHPIDFYSVDEHFGSEADLIELVSKAHQRGIKVLFDMVFNQVASNHPWVNDPQKQSWFHRQSNGSFYPITNWFDQEQIELGALHGMPDLNTENPDVAEYLTKMAAYWVEKTGCDGFRLDAVKHIGKPFWSQFNQTMHQQFGSQFFELGEVFWGEPERLEPYMKLDFNALFDIPGYYAIKNTFAQGGSIADLSDFRRQAGTSYGSQPMATLIDNHDVARFSVGIQSHADAKQKLALAYLLTTPGTPVLYYGTEIGLKGGPLQNPTTGAPQDYVNRLMYPDLLDERGLGMLEYSQNLIHLRKSHPALMNGEFFEIYKDWGVYAFLRAGTSEQLLVVLNNAATSEMISFPRTSKRYAFTEFGEEIFGNGGMIATSDSVWITLEPYSAAIWSVTSENKTKQNPWATFTNRLTGDYTLHTFTMIEPGFAPANWSVAGDFTNWKPRHFPVEVFGDTLKMMVPLHSGRYRYKFVLDNSTWVKDSLAEDEEPDPYGGRNSLVIIP